MLRSVVVAAVLSVLTYACGAADDAQEVEQRSFQLTSMRQSGEPEVVAETSIPAPGQPPGQAMVPIRLTVTPFDVVGDVQRNEARLHWEHTVMLYRVSPTTSEAGFEWRLACPWSSVGRSKIMVDSSAGVAYFVTYHHAHVVAVPIARETRTVEQLVTDWVCGRLPQGATMVSLGAALGDTMFSPVVLGPKGDDGYLNTRADYLDNLRVEAVARAEDGTWSFTVTSALHDVKYMMIGQGDDWHWQAIEAE